MNSDEATSDRGGAADRTRPKRSKERAGATSAAVMDVKT
jgi:hypothetical protein